MRKPFFVAYPQYSFGSIGMNGPREGHSLVKGHNGRENGLLGRAE